MLKKRLSDISDLAFTILTTSNITAPPVDVEKIANAHGISVIPHPFPSDTSGVLVEKNGVFTIGVNSTHAENRKRFTIAHELGHYFLKHKRGGIFVDETSTNIMFRDAVSSTSANVEEVEANAFAAALLMPQSFVITYIKECQNIDLVGDDFLNQMAAKFKVSTGAMAFRLSNLRIFI